ncbi:MAG: hypothetical protein K2Q32_00155 [Alphaproteobacteria bacterium]|nr:hypothetical protein [Alphaproteobacteria bacterium]
MPRKLIPTRLDRVPSADEINTILVQTEAMLAEKDETSLWESLSSVGVRNDSDARRLFKQLLEEDLGKTTTSVELAGQCLTLLILKKVLKRDYLRMIGDLPGEIPEVEVESNARWVLAERISKNIQKTLDNPPPAEIRARRPRAPAKPRRRTKPRPS